MITLTQLCEDSLCYKFALMRLNTRHLSPLQSQMQHAKGVIALVKLFEGPPLKGCTDEA